jgi:SAM-dependent methyltransferase
MNDVTNNASEIAYWNEEAGLRWAELQRQIDASFAPLMLAALEQAAVRPGEAVVDIGCGCGATVLELAQRVGPTGGVLGVDVSRPMLAAAEQSARAAGHANVQLVLADASAHPFEANAFDLAFSRFGVMFFDRPSEAFANIRQSIKPGGRLTFVCWRSLGENPWFHVPIDAAKPHVPAQPKSDPDAPGPLAFAKADRIFSILSGAGFTSIDVNAFDAPLPIGTRTSALHFISRIGPVSRLLAGATPEQQAMAISAIDQALGAYEADDLVALGAGVWIVSARA